MKLTLWYTVQNGGDGSAYPKFVESEELAEWDQSHMDEGWGESCTGSITVEGDNLICTEVQSTVEYYLDLLLEDENNRQQGQEFKAKFFPDGLPEFTVKISRDNYYGVYVGDELAYESFAYPENKALEKGRRKFEHELRNALAETEQ